MSKETMVSTVNSVVLVNKKEYLQWFSDRLKLQLYKITVPKSQRLFVCITTDDNTTNFEWYDSKEEFVNDIKKNCVYNQNVSLNIEVVCRNKQIDIGNQSMALYNTYLQNNKFI